MVGVRSCKYCGETKPLSSFRKGSRPRKDGTEYYFPYCSTCNSYFGKSSKYGLTMAQVLEWKARENCEICDTHLPELRQRLIDHCHETGKARGILCIRCNSILGMLENPPIPLTKYFKYINKHE